MPRVLSPSLTSWPETRRPTLQRTFGLSSCAAIRTLCPRKNFAARPPPGLGGCRPPPTPSERGQALTHAVGKFRSVGFRSNSQTLPREQKFWPLGSRSAPGAAAPLLRPQSEGKLTPTHPSANFRSVGFRAILTILAKCAEMVKMVKMVKTLTSLSFIFSFFFDFSAAKKK